MRAMRRGSIAVGRLATVGVVAPATARMTLPDRYRVVRHIANGGMAGVWEAHDELLDRRVAVKVLAPHLGEDDRARALAGSLLVAGLLFVVAWGMWRARYWAVLGMQTLLALTLIASALALVTASSAGGAILLVAILAAAGTLFWFMVKAMARIQMPERPTRAR